MSQDKSIGLSDTPPNSSAGQALTNVASQSFGTSLGGLQLDAEIANRVRRELAAQLPDEVAKQLGAAFEKRAILWRSVLRNLKYVLPGIVIVLSGGYAASRSDLRIKLHRNLLDFDQTLSEVMSGSVVYVTGGTFTLRGAATGDSATWKLPLLIQEGQDFTIRLHLDYRDPKQPFPLQLLIQNSAISHPIVIGKVVDSYVLENVMKSALAGRDSLSHRDDMSTLLVVASDDIRFRKDFVSGSLVVQVVRAKATRGRAP